MKLAPHGILLQPPNRPLFKDALKQFRRYPQTISELDAPSYNRNVAATEPSDTVVKINFEVSGQRFDKS